MLKWIILLISQSQYRVINYYYFIEGTTEKYPKINSLKNEIQ